MANGDRVTVSGLRASVTVMDASIYGLTMSLTNQLSTLGELIPGSAKHRDRVGRRQRQWIVDSLRRYNLSRRCRLFLNAQQCLSDLLAYGRLRERETDSAHRQYQK
jgi:hypothetical protein